MASLHSASLRRRLDALTETVRRTVEYREELREKAKAWATIRAALAAAVACVPFIPPTDLGSRANVN